MFLVFIDLYTPFQEMDHLKMAVAKIDAHHPNVLLVEKSVSRYAQEYLLAKDISLVLNIKRPLLERIARCTGAQIVPSIDHLITPKLGYCDTFHVAKFLEEHGSAGQGGKKLTKTLMFFEDCPKPLGCTVSPNMLTQTNKCIFFFFLFQYVLQFRVIGLRMYCFLRLCAWRVGLNFVSSFIKYNNVVIRICS
jgi:hypothetical protein